MIWLSSINNSLQGVDRENWEGPGPIPILRDILWPLLSPLYQRNCKNGFRRVETLEISPSYCSRRLTPTITFVTVNQNRLIDDRFGSDKSIKVTHFVFRHANLRRTTMNEVKTEPKMLTAASHSHHSYHSWRFQNSTSTTNFDLTKNKISFFLSCRS